MRQQNEKAEAGVSIKGRMGKEKNVLIDGECMDLGDRHQLDGSTQADVSQPYAHILKFCSNGQYRIISILLSIALRSFVGSLSSWHSSLSFGASLQLSERSYVV